MAGLVCPECGTHIEVFPRTTDERSLRSDGIPVLATIPLDPAFAHGAEDGRAVFDAVPDSPSARIFRELADRVVAALDEPRADTR